MQQTEATICSLKVIYLGLMFNTRVFFFFLFSASLALLSCESTLLCLTRVPRCVCCSVFLWVNARVSMSYLSTCPCRRRPEEYDLHSRKRPRNDGPPDFNQRAGCLFQTATLRLFFQKRDVFTNVNRKFCIVHFQRTNVGRRGGI